MTECKAPLLLDYLERHQQAMVEFLRRLVQAESPSNRPETQQAVLQILQDALAELGFQIQLLPGSEFGGSLVATQPVAKAGDTQLLVGHCDTVWPQGQIDEMPVELSGGRLSGPGVYDMKSGLTQMVFALRALRDLGLPLPLSPVVFINTDEELGSRESSDHVIRLAKLARRAFILEPSLGQQGKLKTARKGVGRFTIVVKGRAAHAGLNPEQGASAIAELALVIQQLFALNNPATGTSVNVGMIEGGLGPNVVAPESRAAVDVRVLTTEEAERVSTAIRDLKPTTPNTHIEVSGGIGRPPMESTPANRKLWQLAQNLGEQMGLHLEQGTAGGGSDGNFTSQYTATLDGLGGVGDGAHAIHEFVSVDELPRRTALLALLLLADDVPADRSKGSGE